MKSKSKLKFEDEKIQTTDNNKTSNEDRALWLIWIGLIILAVTALPFIARAPALVGYIADLCLSVIP